MTKNSNHSVVLLGTIRLSHMIPVPATELKKYDLEKESDIEYKNLVKDELSWIEKNDTDIIKSAKIVYDLKTHEGRQRNNKNERLLKAILPFFTLQQLCSEWKSTHK